MTSTESSCASQYIWLFCLTMKGVEIGTFVFKHIHETMSHSDKLRLFGVLATLSAI